MSASGLRYQTIQVENRSIPVGGPSPGSAAVGAGVKLLYETMKALSGWAVSWRVNHEIEKLKPQLDAALDRVEQPFRQSRPDAGVLVVAGIAEWAVPDATGTRAQTFLEVHIGGAGMDAAAVLRQYLSQPRLVRGPANGWRRYKGKRDSDPGACETQVYRHTRSKYGLPSAASLCVRLPEFVHELNG